MSCKFCHFPVSENFYYCPNCGKNLKPAPLPTSITKQLYIYAISVFLPPLGLIPAIKYLLNKDQKAKMVGIIAIILTFASLIVAWIVFQNIVNNFINSVNQLNELQNVQNLQNLQNIEY